MDRGRVGDERGSKEMDGCPLTESAFVMVVFWFNLLLCLI
jgi:hypothetical protein